MGTIPAPNIFADSQAIAQAPQNALAEYARVAQLRQQTAASQQTQQLEAQEAQQKQAAMQRAMQDRDALTQAMTEYDPQKNKPEEVTQMILKHGGSGDLAKQYQASLIDQMDKASQMHLRDAQTGETNIKNERAKIDQTLGVLDSHKQVPDEQLAPSLSSALDQLEQTKGLDPGHLQQGRQLLAQNLPPAEIRKQLDVFEKGLQTHSQIFDEAEKQEKLRIEQEKAMRLPVDQQEMADWLRKNPGKGPSDFLSWKAKLSPMAVVLGNMLGNAGKGDFESSNPVDIAAKKYNETGGELPTNLSRSPGTTTAIIKRAAELSGGSDLASNKATFAANKSGLQKVQTQADVVGAFEKTAIKNLDQVIITGNQIPDLGVRFANVPIRMMNEKMIGTENMAKFKAALLTAQTETAKVLNSATGSGVLSDSARKELEDMLSGNLPYPAMVGAIKQLKTDMNNREQSYNIQIADIKKRMGGKAEEGGTKATHRFNPSTGKIEVIQAQ